MVDNCGGEYASKIWGIILFSGWKYMSIFDKKTRTSSNFPADMFLLQPCYVMTDFFCSSHGNKDFWSAKQNTVYGLRGYTFFFITEAILIHERSWSGSLVSCSHPPFNNLCFVCMITCKCEFLFVRNVVTNFYFCHSIGDGRKFVMACCNYSLENMLQVESWQAKSHICKHHICIENTES